MGFQYKTKDDRPPHTNFNSTAIGISSILMGTHVVIHVSRKKSISSDQNISEKNMGLHKFDHTYQSRLELLGYKVLTYMIFVM